MEKDFDRWNEIKKVINIERRIFDPFPRLGEVWMSILGKNIGFEQNGGGDNFARPVLVVKKFNNQMFWVVPLSTQQKDFDFYYNFVDPQNQGVSAILAQMRLVSVKRFKRKMYAMEAPCFSCVIKRLRGFL